MAKGVTFPLPKDSVPVFRPTMGMFWGTTSAGHIFRNDEIKPGPRWFLTLGDDGPSGMNVTTDLVLLIKHLVDRPEFRPILEAALEGWADV